jgi:catechol-2,3-dioxygenase
MAGPRLEGFGHIDLTVTDGERSVRWWTEVLGFRLTVSSRKAGFRVWNMYHPSDVHLALLVHDELVSNRFDERAVGLDHFALKVRDRPTLRAWAEHLDRIGVAYSGIKEEIGGPLITLRDPDNVQVELWVFDPSTVERPPALQRRFASEGTRSA